MNDSGMGEFAREDVHTVLGRFGIAAASRAVGTDESEEVVLLTAEDFVRVDPDAVARALMEVLPHTKVWVIQEHPAWSSEPV